MQISFAPLEGITNDVFRRAHRNGLVRQTAILFRFWYQIKPINLHRARKMTSCQRTMQDFVWFRSY